MVVMRLRRAPLRKGCALSTRDSYINFSAPPGRLGPQGGAEEVQFDGAERAGRASPHSKQRSHSEG